ncbi:hypothetical protein, variant [Saprolegnia diclina VS20]|uniref:Uncharacterized protein n=1 Tax=Saprolegnia diclina (strain VS20) TaxID=1156394 RepID=T0RYD2_SAPDV|nr:hypothetical protein, variant [Saprolegnia diclina VS20]EQC37568.1 hypothetical protein, variant [Saprolegnia diclina VS20]|eukprot:XP_008609088.1 hypothetical protein, variant [Saprolegnia diclina VS20]
MQAPAHETPEQEQHPPLNPPPTMPSKLGTESPSAEATTTLTNLIVAFLEISSSFLRFKHTGPVASQSLQAVAAALEKPMVIKALCRIMQTIAMALEKEIVLESVAQSLDMTANKLKKESVTTEAIMQLILNLSAQGISGVNTLLDQDVVLKGYLDALETFKPVLHTAKDLYDYSMTYPAVSYMVSQLQHQATARGHHITSLLTNPRVHTAISTATSLTTNAWNQAWEYSPFASKASNAEREKLRSEVMLHAQVPFAGMSLEDMLSTNEQVRDAMVRLAVAKDAKIAQLEKSLADTNQYATELAEAIAKGPYHKRPPMSY